MKKRFIKNIISLSLVAGLIFTTSACGVVITTEDASSESGSQSVDISETDSESVGGEVTGNQSGTDNSENSSSNDVIIPRLEDDYYAYINKQTLMDYEVTSADLMKGSDVEIQKEVEDEIWKLVERVAAESQSFEAGSSEKVLAEAYKQCGEFVKTKKSSASDAFQKVVSQINAIETTEDALNVMKLLRDEYGMITIFDAEVECNYFSGEDYMLLIDRKYELLGEDIEDVYEADDSRENIMYFVTDALVAAGEAPSIAREKAKAFTYYAIDIAFHTDFEKMHSNTPFIEFDFYTEAEMDELLTNVAIADLEKVYGFKNLYGGWYVGDSDQFAYIAKVFEEDNLDILKTYLISEFVNTYKMFLAYDYQPLDAYANVSQAQDKDIYTQFASKYMSNQISEVYAKYYYTEEMDALLTRMQNDIKQSYRDIISNVDWLTEDTKEMLLKKLENMYFVCGDGNVRVAAADNRSFIGKDAFETAVHSNKYKLDLQTRMIGKKIDKTVSIMESHIVNAAYSPINTFTITVGIMHGQMFDVNASYEENLGGLGMVIGHEMGHAFDSNCINFDENGKYDPDRICQADKDELTKRCKEVEEYYSSFAVMDVYYVNGERTSGENYADLGAMECLDNIVKDKAGRVKMYESYARNWCELKEDADITKQMAEDEHSPAVIRVNAVLSSLDGFYQTYDIKPGDGMYKAPEDRVSRWY